MVKKRVLITGASGFIGSALFKKIYDSNIFGTIHKSKNLQKFTSLRKVDLTNKNKTLELLKDTKPELIFHLAGLVSPIYNEANPHQAYKINCQITKNLVTQMEKNVHFIFLSTDKIYTQEATSFKENQSVNPKTLYGILKMLSEQMIVNETDKYHILRIPKMHSVGSRISSSFIDKAIIKIRLGKKVGVFSNVKRRFVRIDELINFLNILVDDVNYGIYNVGSTYSSYVDRLKLICRENNLSYKKLILPKKGCVFPLEQNINIDKFKNTFNFSFT